MQILLSKSERYIVPLSIIFVGIIISFSFILIAQAQPNPFDSIEYPIEELGGCTDQNDCHDYCDDISNLNACLDFAEAHNLMSKEEIEHARKFATEDTPGQCRSGVECEAYCEDISNLNECLAFAEEHDVLDDDELEEARRIAAALAGGAELPGGCVSKRECEAYCSVGEHIEECVAFAEAAGFISPEELDEIRRIMPLIAAGETPGGCQNREECEEYCENEVNHQECFTFAEKAGLISPEQAKMFRATGGVGPGGCRGETKCRSYCENPDHQRECIAFAKEHGLEGEFKHDIEEIERQMEDVKRLFDKAPLKVLSCIEEGLGADFRANVEAGNAFMNHEDSRVIQMCFENFFGSPDDRHLDIPDEFDEEGNPVFRLPEGDVLDCLIEIHGPGVVEEFTSGDFNPGSDTERKVGECMAGKKQQGFGIFEFDGDDQRPPIPYDGRIEFEEKEPYIENFQYEKTFNEQYEAERQGIFETRYEEERKIIFEEQIESFEAPNGGDVLDLFESLGDFEEGVIHY